MFLQQFLVSIVKADGEVDGDCGRVRIQYREPDVGEMKTVGLLAVGTRGQCRDRSDPQNDANRDELEDVIPYPLFYVRFPLSFFFDRKVRASLPSSKTDF